MKQRHKILTAVSVAAVLTVLCAALALAAGTLVKPRVDRVVAARGSGEGGGGAMTAPEPTPAPTSTPEVTPKPTPTPAASDELSIVYTQPSSSYYHSDPTCSGMEGAIEWTEASAISVGKQPCPVCIGAEPTPETTDTAAPEVMGRNTPTLEQAREGESYAEEYADDDNLALVFYATLDGKYYHGNEHCSDMRGAMPWSFAALWFDGKQPCPVCLATFDAPEVKVYATPKGKYYHVYRDCSGMKNAYALDEAYAKEKGKAPCPVCVSGLDALCWATPEGQYYHSEQDCMGMRNARIYNERTMKRQGRQPCPVCWTA